MDTNTHPNLPRYGTICEKAPTWSISNNHSSLGDRTLRIIDGAAVAEYYPHDSVPEIGTELVLRGDMSQLTSGTCHRVVVTGAPRVQTKKVAYGREDEDRSMSGFVTTRTEDVELKLVPVHVVETWCPSWRRAS